MIIRNLDLKEKLQFIFEIYKGFDEYMNLTLDDAYDM